MPPDAAGKLWVSAGLILFTLLAATVDGIAADSMNSECLNDPSQQANKRDQALKCYWDMRRTLGRLFLSAELIPKPKSTG